MKFILFILIVVFNFSAKAYNPSCQYTHVILSKDSGNSFKYFTKKLSLKEKILFKFFIKKIKKDAQPFKYGTISLLSGIAAALVILISLNSIIPFVLAAAAIVFGILGLKKNKKDIAALVGLILGGLFYLLLLFGLIFLNTLK